MSFGLYYPGKSWLHRLPTGLKLAAVAIAGVGLFFVHGIWILAIGLGLSLALVAMARIPVRVIWYQVRPVVVMLLLLVGIHAVLTQWQTGVVLALRFSILIVLATLTSLTTRTTDMVEAIALGLRPLRPWGVNPEQVSLMVAIALRFIPVLLEQIHQIRDAQRARGVERPLLTLMVPLLVRTLRLADDLVDALEARGFDPSDSSCDSDITTEPESDEGDAEKRPPPD